MKRASLSPSRAPRAQLCIFVLAITLGASGSHGEYAPQEGDVVFQSLPHNPLIDTIEGSTGSPFSHCGILRKAGVIWKVIEAIGPVKETDLDAWEKQGRDGQFTVYRLKPRYRDKIPTFITAAQSYEGLPYDYHYEMDDRAIYCSELIYKAFRKATGEELGHLQKLGELKWQPYAPVIKQLEGGTVPLDRVLITPRSVSEAPQLEKVFEQAK
ncbi:protein of unknown function DUF1105 [Chthoniobacter flavus Ellin428]|uniref:Peptidoglycan peptidase n=1 Tax=Chthoniobacter flavus Ellin428 TaxID=497964 RepID=B4D4G3_9BACT|nr:YiiX/YebB-like N1pC/P60 family cysteine hydrolase [Chthoniobacter flavus]EDY18764.1 protein of unknown function DUF1105 [Chthoniobacter flavus Ellin428]TCO88997.1 permuted papain-like amidase YaeF/Yiix C92 family enzyme [Chthoniobacter flavus]